MNRILDILIPRFITERVALIDANGQLEIACALSNVRPNERFDGIATIRSFNLAGFALFPKMVDGPHAWPVQLHPSNKDSADAINLREDVIFNAEDFRRVEREGARLWSERTSRNRHLYDSNAADGHCVYPRSAQ
ncbi:TPA: hypothetical protein NID15_000677 [Pseudomonas aeruginosa]|nr:hypothetical protein [Pseudomonas aeruginosa]ELK4889804.1 hypothetical protein [Pseudomonas aeruginosa]MBG5864098.1 hypothetical protein [Pseudomonas aeruginosa]HCF3809679.1 hypothetical protein [Pseudomonas aeruginosa]